METGRKLTHKSINDRKKKDFKIICSIEMCLYKSQFINA